MNELVKYNKPLLAVLESHTKLRDYTDEERLTISKLLVQDLLNDLGVSKNSDVEHHIRTIKHVSETLGNYTKEEIKKAFQMFISREFNIDVYQQLNSVVVGRVMREFEMFKKQNLQEYRRKQSELKNQSKQMTDEDKEMIMIEAIDRIKKEVQQNGYIDSVCTHVYDHLDSKGLLPTDKESKMVVWEKAKLIAKREAMEKATQSYEEHTKLKTVLEKIEKGQINVVSISKRLVLEEYFKK